MSLSICAHTHKLCIHTWCRCHGSYSCSHLFLTHTDMHTHVYTHTYVHTHLCSACSIWDVGWDPASLATKQRYVFILADLDPPSTDRHTRTHTHHTHAHLHTRACARTHAHKNVKIDMYIGHDSFISSERYVDTYLVVNVWYIHW